MKTFHLIPALLLALMLSGCKDDKKPTVEETQLKLLAKTWTLSEVTLDGVNKKTSSEYNSFKLTISGTYSASDPNAEYNYSVSGRPQLGAWPASGKWTFDTNSPAGTLIRDPGTANEIPVTYSLSDGKLEISFTYQGDGFSGRTSIINGQWVMVFN